jgi:site-specific DNA-cytosine methylase
MIDSGSLDQLQEGWHLVDLGCSTGYTRTSAEGVCPTLLASHGDRDLYCTHKSVARLLSPFEAMLIMGFDHLQLRAASRALIHRSPGRVGKLMGLPEVDKLAGNAVTERSARVLLRTMIVSFPAVFLHKQDK